MPDSAYPPADTSENQTGVIGLDVQYCADDLGSATDVLMHKRLVLGACLLWGPLLLFSYPAGVTLLQWGLVFHESEMLILFGLALLAQVLLTGNTCMRLGRKAWKSRVFIKDPGKILLTPDYVEQRFPLVQGRYAWSCFVGAVETSKHIFLVFEGPSTMIIPKRCIDGADRIDAVRQVVRRGIPADKPVRLWFEKA